MKSTIALSQECMTITHYKRSKYFAVCAHCGTCFQVGRLAHFNQIIMNPIKPLKTFNTVYDPDRPARPVHYRF